MKRLLIFALMLFTLALSVSCTQGVRDPTGESVEVEADMLAPLFRISAYEGQKEPETKYYPTESGIAYISKTKNGYMGGYFMLPNLISNEEIFTCSSTPSAVFDLGDEKAAVFADDKLFLLSLEEGRANDFELHGKMRFTDIILGADGGFYYVNDGLILTADLEFDEKYTSLSVTERVVMATDKIRGFDSLLGVSEDGERLYYTYDVDGERGYAFFGIGYLPEELGKTPVSYRELQRIPGSSRALFSSSAEDGKVTYSLIDFATGEKREISVAAGQEYAAVTVNFKGTHLVGYLAETDGIGGYLDLLDFENGKRVKHYELADLQINKSVCATLSAKYLVVGQYDDGTAYDDHGGETVTSIEVAS